jgi:hypothetical protein
MLAKLAATLSIALVVSAGAGCASGDRIAERSTAKAGGVTVLAAANGCTRMTELDAECAKQSLPPKVFSCGGGPPPSSGCKMYPRQSTYPGGYCCP